MSNYFFTFYSLLFKKAMGEKSRIVIAGVGNLLLRDDGVGVHVVQALQRTSLPDNVLVIDAGTAVIDILTFLENVYKLIIIDAVEGGCEPGTIYRFTPEDVEFEHLIAMSLHEFDVNNMLTMAEMLGHRPQAVVIIGIEPKEIAYGLELSPEIEQHIEELLELILAEVYYTSG